MVESYYNIFTVLRCSLVFTKYILINSIKKSKKLVLSKP